MDLVTLIKHWIPYLEQNRNLAYAILFLGSYFEILIGISFFIYGEFFFLTGGILAGMGILDIWFVILFLFSGGILGDFSSYGLGHRFGHKLYRKFEQVKFFQKYINEKSYKRGADFFQKHGAKSVFLARLLGPVAWITPFLAGIYRLNLKSFFLFDLLGVTIGIGQFILAGYFFGLHYEYILPIISEYISLLILGIASIILARHFWKKRKAKNLA